MIRDHSHLLTKATVKETPFDRLPRSDRDQVVEAERQGFDDGYFGNVYQVLHKQECRKPYDTAFFEGKAQRDRIDGRKKKK